MMKHDIRCIADLHASRPRSNALRWSVLALAAMAVYAWIWGAASGEISFADTFGPRRLRNLTRFLGEIRPYPLHGEAWDWGVAFMWFRGLMADGGLEGTVTTLSISIVAICLAGLFGALFALPAARNLARPDPFVRDPRAPSRGRTVLWGGVVFAVRGLMVFLRAIPEYVWAFLFVRMFGVTAWPAVLALALHNAGIMGRLQGEVIENVEPAAPAALRSLGASRAQVAAFALLPETMNRFLLFFFYRWETCVREATVLGLLGMASLGALVNEARAGQRQDDMLLFILVGGALVVVGDLISTWARGVVRRAD